MKKNLFFLAAMACAFAITSCSSDDDSTPVKSVKKTFGEPVKVSVVNPTRATTDVAVEPGLSATSISFLSNGNALVTYHATDHSLNGKVQVIGAEGDVLSYLETENARINYAYVDGDVAYIGLDRDAIDETTLTKVAVIKVDLTGGKFPTSLEVIADEDTYPLNGVSVNNITKVGDDIVVSTATSEKGWNWDYKQTELENIPNFVGSFCKLDGTFVKGGSAYWVGNGPVYVVRNSAHSTECTATYGDATYAFSSTTKNENKGRVTAEVLPVQKVTKNVKVTDGVSVVSYNPVADSETSFVFTCGDKLTAWAAGEEVQTITNSSCTSVASDGTYLYACHTDGSIGKYYYRQYNAQEKLQFELKGRYALGGDMTASANHVVVKDGKVYVAYGPKGVLILDDSDFTITEGKDPGTKDAE